MYKTEAEGPIPPKDAPKETHKVDFKPNKISFELPVGVYQMLEDSAIHEGGGGKISKFDEFIRGIHSKVAIKKFKPFTDGVARERAKGLLRELRIGRLVKH